MLDIRYVANNFEDASAMLARRGYELDPELVELYEQRRTMDGELSSMRSDGNSISARIGELRRDENATEADLQALYAEARDRKAAIADKKASHDQVASELGSRVLGIPNFPAAHVPDGESDKDNVVVDEWWPETSVTGGSKNHHELGKQLGIIDTETGAKIAGGRFSILRGRGSKLSRALAAFMLDLHEEEGYEEYAVPLMVNRQAMQNTGQLPKFEDDLFKTELGGNPFYLSPTAEVQLTNMGSGDVLDERDLPKKYTALSTNFRSEAGSAGKDLGGIFRQHQFDKVELVQITKPEDSWAALDDMTIDARRVLKTLGLAHRVVQVCTGDLSFGASFTNDIEVWLPGQKNFREISSVSNFTDFQSRRMNMRYKDRETGRNEFPHTLNGSALAVGRAIIAVLEQYQQSDGSIVIPDALQDYTKFSRIE